MLCQHNDSLVFDDGRLYIDLDRNRICLNDHVVMLSPVESQILKCLLKGAGAPVPIPVILDTVWCGGIVTPELARINILRLRRKIEPDPASPAYILNQHGRGYYFKMSH